MQLVNGAFIAADEGGFHGPSLDEFFPEGIFFVGTPFEMNRIMLIRILMTVLVVVVFWLGTRNLRLVPSRGQSIIEMGLDFVRVNIAEEMLGKKDGKRFLPLLTTMFFLIFAFNITGIIPFLNIGGSSVIGFPLVMAVVAYIAFIYAGVKKNPAGFFRNALFPPGVPVWLYPIVTPIEFLSTFVIRPITLTLRLLMNMVVGHLLLVLLFAATHFFILEGAGLMKGLGVGTLLFALVFTLFEMMVAVLQAYVFTVLTTVYIQLALADEH
ncbi:ATP synthase F0 subunit A [Leucobacter sp. OH2974_COT-288]|uniref:ATP synthase subunit a n=1 Tax=Canibacter oris TaxID=1365628 RepID=A0A840DKX9_9MICO|nr:F0F1 ATP synthase subunit A [Canibacter oris]MBB4072132.1 F-type H+-transporting ATPase subunit a [Canibacter oris]RRD36608.1 ATP synthase F0 subunit A [Leucobacter sp. OH2974_COT-288]